jgi:hypothetical protein
MILSIGHRCQVISLYTSVTYLVRDLGEATTLPPEGTNTGDLRLCSIIRVQKSPVKVMVSELFHHHARFVVCKSSLVELRLELVQLRVDKLLENLKVLLGLLCRIVVGLFEGIPSCGDELTHFVGLT